MSTTLGPNFKSLNASNSSLPSAASAHSKSLSLSPCFGASSTVWDHRKRFESDYVHGRADWDRLKGHLRKLKKSCEYPRAEYHLWMAVEALECSTYWQAESLHEFRVWALKEATSFSAEPETEATIARIEPKLLSSVSALVAVAKAQPCPRTITMAEIYMSVLEARLAMLNEQPGEALRFLCQESTDLDLLLRYKVCDDQIIQCSQLDKMWALEGLFLRGKPASQPRAMDVLPPHATCSWCCAIGLAFEMIDRVEEALESYRKVFAFLSLVQSIGMLGAPRIYMWIVASLYRLTRLLKRRLFCSPSVDPSSTTFWQDWNALRSSLACLWDEYLSALRAGLLVFDASKNYHSSLRSIFFAELSQFLPAVYSHFEYESKTLGTYPWNIFHEKNSAMYDPENSAEEALLTLLLSMHRRSKGANCAWLAQYGLWNALPCYLKETECSSSKHLLFHALVSARRFREAALYGKKIMQAGHAFLRRRTEALLDALLDGSIQVEPFSIEALPRTASQFFLLTYGKLLLIVFGRAVEAIQLFLMASRFSDAPETEPEPELLYGLGLAYKLASESMALLKQRELLEAKSLACFERATQLQPAHAAASYALAMHLAQSGQADRAMACCQAMGLHSVPMRLLLAALLAAAQSQPSLDPVGFDVGKTSASLQLCCLLLQAKLISIGQDADLDAAVDMYGQTFEMLGSQMSNRVLFNPQVSIPGSAEEPAAGLASGLIKSRSMLSFLSQPDKSYANFRHALHGPYLSQIEPKYYELDAEVDLFVPFDPYEDVEEVRRAALMAPARSQSLYRYHLFSSRQEASTPELIATVWTLVGTQFLKAGKDDDAKFALSEAAQYDETIPCVTLAQGHRHLTKAQWNEAIAAFLLVLCMDPYDVEACVGLAKAYLELPLVLKLEAMDWRPRQPWKLLKARHWIDQAMQLCSLHSETLKLSAILDRIGGGSLSEFEENFHAAVQLEPLGRLRELCHLLPPFLL